MDRSSCGHENPPEARFCMTCGLALRQEYPVCNAQLPPQARFCMRAGGAKTVLRSFDGLRTEPGG